MTCVSVAFFVLLGQIPSGDPSDLIGQLGAPRYAERQAAATALERLGRRSLPALRAAREQRDPEVRSRAAALLVRIEGALLTEPSLMALDFQEAPLSEVIRSFREQTGVRLMVYPENSPVLLASKVTLHESAPLPFWKAIDRLCEAAHLQHSFGMHAFPVGLEAPFALLEGGGPRSRGPVSDSGPFRVSVIGLHYQSDVSFAQPPQFERNPPEPVAAGGPEGTLSEQFYAQMQVAGEPRLSLIQYAPLRMTEAVDDRGNSLVIPTSGVSDLRRSGYFGIGVGSVIQVRADMKRPQLLGTTIKKLKGFVPVIVSTRKPSPLTVPLTGPAGGTFQNDEVAVTVHEVRVQPNTHSPSIQVTIRPNADNPGESAAGLDVRPDTYQQHLEISDAQGHPIAWYQSSLDSENGRVTLSLASPEQAAAATELRYYSLVRATAEVPFEFANIRMP